MAPALELCTTFGHGYCDLQAVMLSSGVILQNYDFSRQTPWIQPVRSFFTLFVLVTLFLFSIYLAGRFSVNFLTLSADRYFAKPCSSATSVFNEFFNISQNFIDRWKPLHIMVSMPGMNKNFIHSFWLSETVKVVLTDISLVISAGKFFMLHQSIQG